MSLFDRQTVSDSLNMLVEFGLLKTETINNEQTYRITDLGNAVIPGMDEAQRRGEPITRELVQQLIDAVRKGRNDESEKEEG